MLKGYVGRFEWVLLVLFVCYVAFCLTPSSYGLVLNLFGLQGEGLLWGTPRSVRSDEWAVWTPYFQAAINNDFSRYNLNSLYQEDLRSFSALPLADWALIFKPLQWPFFILDEAYAFSMHHALIVLLFIIGWKWLVETILPDTREKAIAGIFALLLFFSGFVQGWWTTLGPLLALTPWLYLTLLWCEKCTWWKALLFCYVSIAWLLSHTYPPIVISSVYVALLFTISFRPSLINVKTILNLALASGVALLVVYVYLKDPIIAVSDTIYPGNRLSLGGEVPWQLWLSAFVPYINHSNFQPLLPTNICELGVITSLLPLMALLFVHYQGITQQQKKILIAFGLGIACMSAWMLLPVPDWLATITLLNRIPGIRMLWALGLTVNLLALYVLTTMSIRLSLQRAIVFLFILLIGYAMASYGYNLPLGKKSAWEILAGIALILLTLICKDRLDNTDKAVLLLVTALTINLAYFADFNPGQSAKPIFSLKNHHAVQPLKDLQAKHPQGWLVVEGYPGAVLQGLGIPSITHVLMTPKLDFFSRLLPDTDPIAINEVFNRYTHIQLTDSPHAYSPQADVARIPKAAFGIEPQKTSFEIMPAPPNLATVSGGHIDSLTRNQAQLEITGWGFFSGPEHHFLISTHSPIAAELINHQRPDVVAALNDSRLHYAGFTLRIDLSNLNNLKQICLYTQDPAYGIRLLKSGDPSQPYQCTLHTHHGSP